MDVQQKQLDDISKGLQEATVQLAQTTTMLRQHINEQRATNARHEKLEPRVRSLELWQQQIITAVPSNLMSGDEVRSKFETVEADIEEVANQVGGIHKTLAKWGGIATAAIFAGQFLLKWIFA